MNHGYRDFRNLFQNFQDIIEKVSEQEQFSQFIQPKRFPLFRQIEKEGLLVLEVEVPGVKKEDLSVEVKRDSVRVKGTRHNPFANDNGSSFFDQANFDFDERIQLKRKIDAQNAKANYENGILTIQFSDEETESATKIQID